MDTSARIPRTGRRTLLGGSAAALLLSGCARSERTPLGAWPTKPPTEEVTITWWTGPIDDRSDGNFIPSLLEAFNQRHPNIKVQVLLAPASSDVNRTSLATQIMSGSTSPDVYLGDVVWPGQFAANRLAMPLNSLVPDDYFDGYPAGVREAARVDGTYYMFPLYIDAGFLFYRKDLLAKHGLRVPRTWEQLADHSRRLVEAGDVSYGFVFQGDVYEGLTCSVTEFVADAGGSVINEDYSAGLATSSEVRRAFTFMTSLITTGASPRAVLTYQEQESMDAFKTGRAAFLRNWSSAWGSSNGDESTVSGNIGMMARPGFEGSPESRHAAIGGWGMFLNPHTRHPAAALTFASWLSSDEPQRLFGREGASLPARESGLPAPGSPADDRPVFGLLPDLSITPRPTATPYYPKVSQSIYVNGHAILSGQTDVTAGTATMQHEIDLALRGEAL